MRKKELIQQNLNLYEQLEEANLEISDLKRKINSLSMENQKLKSKQEKKEEVLDEIETEPLKKLKEKIVIQANIKPEFQYGAKIIGEIVVDAAQYSNKLTADGETANRELVNLILGRTEVAKSEILTIVSSDDGIEVKTSLIDAVAASTREYFESVMAQLN